MSPAPQRRLCLITGASAGLGAEFARQYAARGWDIVLTARREDRLKTLADELAAEHAIRSYVIAQDLAEEGAVDKILEGVAKLGRHIDGLVNNAGYGLPGTFYNTDWNSQEQFLRVLYSAPIELVHKILPSMAERNFGRIINVASLAGYSPGSTGHTLYASVKAGLIRFSESIEAESRALGLTNIHCTALCPGFTYSEFHDVNGTRDKANAMPKWLWMDAEPVVKKGIDAVDAGKPVVVPGGVNKALATISRLVPEGLGRKIVEKQSSRFRRLDGD